MILFESFFADSNNRINKDIEMVTPFLHLWLPGHQGNIAMYTFADIVYFIK